MQTITYFTAGTTPTISEQAEIANFNNLSNPYKVNVVNSQAAASYGNTNLSTDYVAGSVPGAFSAFPVLGNAPLTANKILTVSDAGKVYENNTGGLLIATPSAGCGNITFSQKNGQIKIARPSGNLMVNMEDPNLWGSKVGMTIANTTAVSLPPQIAAVSPNAKIQLITCTAGLATVPFPAANSAGNNELTAATNRYYTAKIWVQGIGTSIGKKIYLYNVNAGSNQFILVTLTAGWQQVIHEFVPTQPNLVYVIKPADNNAATLVNGEQMYICGHQMTEGNANVDFVSNAAVTPIRPAFQITGPLQTTTKHPTLVLEELSPVKFATRYPTTQDKSKMFKDVDLDSYATKNPMPAENLQFTSGQELTLLDTNRSLESGCLMSLVLIGNGVTTNSPVLRANFINFYIDGESTPSITHEIDCFGGINVPNNSGPFYNGRVKIGRVWTGSDGSSLIDLKWNYPIPFSKSIKITMTGTNSGRVFCNAEIRAGVKYGYGYRVSAIGTANRITGVTPAQQRTQFLKFLNLPFGVGTSGLIAGFMMSASGANASFLENNIVVYTSAERAAAACLAEFDSTGTEDIFEQAFYFGAGAGSFGNSIVTYCNTPGNASAFTAQVDFLQKCGGITFTDGCLMTLQEGYSVSPGLSTTNADYSYMVVWYQDI